MSAMATGRAEGAAVGAADRLSLAEWMMRVRLRRGRFFPGLTLADPAWDMLLALYIDEQQGAESTVTSTGTLSGVPPTTALRYLATLVEPGLVEKRTSSRDMRLVVLRLTDQTRRTIEAYLDWVGSGAGGSSR